jgi:hypothetical protein
MSLLSETFSTIVACQEVSAEKVSTQDVIATNVVSGTVSVENEVEADLVTANIVGTSNVITTFLNQHKLAVQHPIVAVGESRDIVYSPDGYNFTQVSLNLMPSTINDVAGNQEVWIAVGYRNAGSGNPMALSYDGIHWFAHPNPPLTDFNAIHYNGTLWVCGGLINSLPHCMFFSEIGGYQWTVCSGYTFASVQQITFVKDKWIAVGQPNTFGASSQAYSYDGKTWYEGQGDSIKFQGISVAGTDGLIVAYGYGDTAANMMVHSTDGIHWSNTPGAPSTTSTGYSVAVNDEGTLWVCTGEGAPLWWSENGLNWQNNSGGPSIRVGQLCWDGVKFVGVGLPLIGGTYDHVVTNDGYNWRLPVDNLVMVSRATRCKPNLFRGPFVIG